MTVVLVALLATATPASHPPVHRSAAVQRAATSAPSPTQTLALPFEDENKRIVDATVQLAHMTFWLALATSTAVIVPLIVGAYQNIRRRKVARGQLSHILYFFKDRTGFLNEFPEEDARALLSGLDAALTRALADDIGDALSPNDADICYNALFSAHGAISRAISQQQQAREDPLASGTAEMSIKQEPASPSATSRRRKIGSVICWVYADANADRRRRRRGAISRPLKAAGAGRQKHESSCGVLKSPQLDLSHSGDHFDGNRIISGGRSMALRAVGRLKTLRSLSGTELRFSQLR